MAKTALKSVSSSSSSSSSSSNDSIRTISGRQSKELVIAFCGAIGAGIKGVKKVTKIELEELGYDVIDLRLSSLMPNICNKSELPNSTNAFERYNQYQDLGDKLRQRHGLPIMAEAAIHHIGVLKQQAIEAGKIQIEEDQRKIAYLIDQLKSPSEVELFRLVYPGNFYLIGVIRSEEERRRNLRDEGIDEQNIDELIRRDRKSAGDEGQQTEKTILDSDVFIHNSQAHLVHLKASLSRFIGLIHGRNGITPTLHEKGMFSAFSASLQSACLSRQVGAAILDSSGNTIAIGRNDVPKAFGGLYNAEDGTEDFRCVHKSGKCYNNAHKIKLEAEIASIIAKKGIPRADILAKEICKGSRISSILEFSRSIHAEMDAITSLAREGNASTKDTVLYTTTYPCHNCARHIVAAGIVKTIYIETYPKSLALDLHDDAITNGVDQSKVVFESFEGISPRRYAKFFYSAVERKDTEGNAIRITNKHQNPVDIQFLDGYRDYEKKIVDYFEVKIKDRM